MNEMTTIPVPTTLKDWESDQEVRWCPGCGDYAILKAVQRTLPELGADPRYATHVARGANQTELDALVNAWTRTLTVAEVDAAMIEVRKLVNGLVAEARARVATHATERAKSANLLDASVASGSGAIGNTSFATTPISSGMWTTSISIR